MSLTTATRLVNYTLSGSGQTLPVTFKFFAATDLVVVKTVAGVDTTLAISTDYTVTGGGSTAATGNVIMVAGTAGDVITIYGAEPYTQATDLTNNGPFPAATLTAMVDRLTIMVQQTRLEIGRSLRIPNTNAVAAVPAMTLADRSGAVIAFDSSGNLDWTLGADYYANVIAAAAAAAASETAAAGSATSAASSASSASTSAGVATAAETAVAANAATASAAATSATGSATSATSSAATASTAATSATASATAAAVSATSAASHDSSSAAHDSSAAAHDASAAAYDAAAGVSATAAAASAAAAAGYVVPSQTGNAGKVLMTNGTAVSWSSALTGVNSLTAATATHLTLAVSNGTTLTPKNYNLAGGRLVTDGNANFEHVLSINADLQYGVTYFGDNVLALQQLGTTHGQCAIRYLDQNGNEKSASGLGLTSGFENAYFIAIGSMVNDNNATMIGFKVIHQVEFAGGGYSTGTYTPLEVAKDGTITLKKFQSTANFVQTPTGRLLLGGVTDDTATAFQSAGSHKLGTAGTSATLQLETGTDSSVFLTARNAGRVAMINSQTGGNVAQMKNSAADGYCTLGLANSSGSEKGYLGFGNASVGNTALRGVVYLYGVASIPVAIYSGDALTVTFGSDQSTALAGNLTLASGKTMSVASGLTISASAITAAAGTDLTLNAGTTASNVRFVNSYSGGDGIIVKNSDAAGYSTTAYQNSSGSTKFIVGTGNASAGNTALRGVGYLYGVSGIPVAIYSGDTLAVTFAASGQAAAFSSTTAATAYNAAGATFAGGVGIAESATFKSITAPAAPSASNARLYADTSGGKVRLSVIFPSGAAQLLATEP